MDAEAAFWEGRGEGAAATGGGISFLMFLLGLQCGSAGECHFAGAPLELGIAGLAFVKNSAIAPLVKNNVSFIAKRNRIWIE